MVLAKVYGCLGFLLNLALIRLPQAERDAELVLLRHELGVLRRSVKKPRLRPWDRILLTVLAMRLPRSRWGALIVRPGTILGWHRALVRQKWAAYGRRRRPGRPRLPEQCRELILRLAKENSGWGYVRIRGELLKLGYSVSSTAIRNLLRRQGVPTSPRRSEMSWRQFLRAQAATIVAADYFTVDIWNLKRLHVLFFIGLATRRIPWFGVTEKPDQAWVSQQARNLTWELQELGLEPRFLICDNDKKFPFAFENTLAAEGLTVIRTPFQAPMANAYAERWVGSVRQECLDWLIILGRRHLERVLDEYVDHYNRARPHRGLLLQPPNGEVGQARLVGEIKCRARLGGLLREYARMRAVA
jgi:putative transposase